MTWVRWAFFHTDKSSGSVDNGISIDQYGVDILKSSYGDVVLARVHTHPDNTCFSYEDISTFAFTGGIIPAEENNGSFSVLVTNKIIYAIEMINTEIAFSIYFQLGGASRIENIGGLLIILLKVAPLKGMKSLLNQQLIYLKVQ